MTKNEKFIKLPYEVFDSPEFKALEHIDIRVLLLLIRKYNGFNNGGIQLGVREVVNKCVCGMATASRSLANLQKNGLISATYKGHLVPEYGRPNVPTRWRLNFVPESSDMDGRKRFPNETAGCFSNGTSPPTPDRFSNGTSPRVPPEKRSIDNLTRTKSEGDGRTKGREAPSPAAPGDDLADSRQHPTAEQSNPGKPNGKDHGTLQHAGGDTIH